MGFALSATGCALFSHAPHAKKAKTARAEPVIHRLVGTISMVNEQDHFVLVNVGTVIQPPASGSALRCVRSGSNVGTVVATKDQNPPFIIANIRDGSPRQGDLVEVRD